VDIYSACDYIIWTVRRSGATLCVLKLQKLLYYAQAWHLALQGEPLFQGKFQAWTQGPVNREIYDRLARSGSLYSELSDADVPRDFAAAKLPEGKRAHLDRVLEAYGKYDEAELQEMIAHEAPWQEAASFSEERCERQIDEGHMRRYCTVQYLVGWQENDSHTLFGCPVFHLPSHPDAASAGNWLAREANSVASGRAS
jgi:uncharacterized phage-associated protein